MAGGRERLCGGSEVNPSPGWKQNARIKQRNDTQTDPPSSSYWSPFQTMSSESNRIGSDQIRFDCMARDRTIGWSDLLPFAFTRSFPLGFHFPFAHIDLIAIHQSTELHSKRNRSIYGCRKPTLFLSLTILPFLCILHLYSRRNERWGEMRWDEMSRDELRWDEMRCFQRWVDRWMDETEAWSVNPERHEILFARMRLRLSSRTTFLLIGRWSREPPSTEQSRPDAVKKFIHWVVDSIGSWKAALAREGERNKNGDVIRFCLPHGLSVLLLFLYCSLCWCRRRWWAWPQGGQDCTVH